MDLGTSWVVETSQTSWVPNTNRLRANLIKMARLVISPKIPKAYGRSFRLRVADNQEGLKTSELPEQRHLFFRLRLADNQII